MGILDEYKAQLKEHQKLGEMLREKGQSIFEEAAKELFKNNPSLKSFSWTQYTPHFNDGDPCTFSVHAYSENISLNGLCSDEAPYDHKTDTFLTDKIEEWKGIEHPETLIDEICELLDLVDEDCLKNYGEGKIIVFKDGNVKCEYYSHD